MAGASTPERLHSLADELSGSLAAERRSRERAAAPRRWGAGGHAAGAARLAGQIRTRIEHVADRWLFPLGAWLYRRSNGRIVHLWHRRALIFTAAARSTGTGSLRTSMPMKHTIPDRCGHRSEFR